MSNVLVAGAGGFIGGHLVKELLQRGHVVRAVDCKPRNQWYQRHGEAENWVEDLAIKQRAVMAVSGQHFIFNLAADMGGIGFIEGHKADCMMSVLINTNLLHSAKLSVFFKRYFFSSSACVYAADKQTDPHLTALKESDAYPAMPEDGYGWEKLFSERLCRHYREDYNIDTRVARYHNVYGPYGTYDGGREKAPAALCRKIATAKLSGARSIDLWGDGEQSRSFMYIDDCVEGTLRIMGCNYHDPLNLGSSELVTINELAQTIAGIAGMPQLELRHDLSAPTGVRGRNSDNALIQAATGWQPSISLYEGLEKTYAWVYDQVKSRSSTAA